MSKSKSARLLNYTERVIINGAEKTVFYSEHSTNAVVGDKLFILNGNFDSDSFIYKYARNSKFVDGYKVLAIDRCKITLDIDWDYGLTAYEPLELTKFIKIWNVRSIRELDYYASIYVDLYSKQVNRYSYRKTNDMIFIDQSFDISSIVTGTFVTDTPNNGPVPMLDPRGSFFGLRDGVWVDDSIRVNYNTFGDDFFDTLYSTGETRLSNNGKIFIIGEDIVTNDGLVLRQRAVYSYFGNSGEYVIDIAYKQPIISKLNFRGGVFSGNYNNGIFGTYLEPIKWQSSGKWNGGFFINSSWDNGTMDSAFVAGDETTFAHIDGGTIVQISDVNNNGGFGYNYVIDSNISGGTIKNGNFRNCNIGTDIVVSGKYSDIGSGGFSLNLNGGNYELCDIKGVSVENSTLSTSNVSKSAITDSRIIDSQIDNSYVYKSRLISNSGITIIGAEIVSDLAPGLNSVVFGSNKFSDIYCSLKMWISEEDYYKIDSLESVYITKLNKSYFISGLSDDEKIKLPVETKLVLDNFFNSDLSENQLICVARTKDENKFQSIVSESGIELIRDVVVRVTPEYSIDLIMRPNPIMGTTFAFYTDQMGNITSNNNVLNGMDVGLLFGGSQMSNFGINSGFVDESIWVSGSNVGTRELRISVIATYGGLIRVTVPALTQINYKPLIIGDNLWIDGAYANGEVIRSEFKVTNIFGDEVQLISMDGTTFDNVSIRTGYDSLLSRTKIENSTITGGVFIRSLLSGNVIESDAFDSTSSLKTSDINRLTIIETNFDSGDHYNTIKNGIFSKCHFLSGSRALGGILSNSTWTGNNTNIFNGATFLHSVWTSGEFLNGEFLNSVWYNGTFENGTFKNKSSWQNGNFKSGSFYNSEWLGGAIYGGTFGDVSYPAESTTVSGVTTVTFATVVSAIFGNGSELVWNDGIFNGGQFVGGIWNNGSFNGGSFSGGIWTGGSFNGGKFTSVDNSTNISSGNKTNYTWQGGEFNGGEFGNMLGFGLNPTWFDGIFQGGVFQGYFWYNGVFTNGIFKGNDWESSDIGVVVNDYLDISSAQYGIWNNGSVVNNKFEVLTEQTTYDISKRTRDAVRRVNSVEFKNMLWKNGKFSHSNAYFNNSVWLSGVFDKGFFNGGVFNPYVGRIFGAQPSFEQTTWTGGTFNSGVMYRTNWMDGTFNGGDMWGSIWENGTWNYGFANGVLWKGGRWRNGNWDGSPYTNLLSGSGILADNFSKDLISFIDSGITDPVVKNKIHITNHCAYERVVDSPDFLAFPRKWVSVNGTEPPTTYVTQPGTSSEEFRLTMVYCDDTKCYDDADVFLDPFYGYELAFSFGPSSDALFVYLTIGDMKGDPNPSYKTNISPGTYGFDSEGNPVMRLSNTSFVLDITYFPSQTNINKSATYRIANEGTVVATALLPNILVTRIKTIYKYGNNDLIKLSDFNGLSMPGIESPAFVENGNSIMFKYGNGLFTHGVWENGVWSNGYRSDDSICIINDVVEFIQVNEFVYTIKVDIKSTLSNYDQLYKYKKGDKVSVSNIIGIDYNDNRKLLKGNMVVRTEITNRTTSVILEVVSNSQLRLIRKDSEFHDIKMSSNVWLAGVFLNGVYNGIMNYGIVSGYPYITELKETHMIDGIFDGGKIGNNSMVQNFIFYDNVVIKRNFHVLGQSLPIDSPVINSDDRYYRSWAAFRYNSDNDRVNIYSDDTIFSNKWQRNIPVINHSGRSTNDVLSSRSRFMNLNNIDFKTYDLGVKKAAYNAFMPQNGLFTYPFQVGSQNSSVGEFVANGWVYKTIGGSALPTLSANYLEGSVSNSNIMFVVVGAGASFVLNNTGPTNLYTEKYQPIDSGRYSVIEFNLRKFTGSVLYDTDTPSLYFDNSPQHYSINKSIENHLIGDKPGKIRREYFYNKKNLDLYLLSNVGNSTFEFRSVNFNELDMIPFFDYFGDENTINRIDDSAKSPKFISAPKIMYSDSYDFIDNVTSTIGITSLNIPAYTTNSDEILGPIVWNPVVNFGALSVSISWEDPAYILNISGYEITYGTSFPYSEPIVHLLSANGEYSQTFTNLIAGQIYYIRIRSIGKLEGRYSNAYVTKSFAISAPVVVPDTAGVTAPGNVYATEEYDTIIVEWTSGTSTNAVSGYEVWRSITANGTYSKIAEVGLVLDYRDRVGFRKTRYYRIKTIDSNGNISDLSTSFGYASSNAFNI